jgi:hypothetical protein
MAQLVTSSSISLVCHAQAIDLAWPLRRQLQNGLATNSHSGASTAGRKAGRAHRSRTSPFQSVAVKDGNRVCGIIRLPISQVVRPATSSGFGAGAWSRPIGPRYRAKRRLVRLGRWGGQAKASATKASPGRLSEPARALGLPTGRHSGARRHARDSRRR